MQTNYQRLFGDPERAARTLFAIAEKVADAVNMDDECLDFCDIFRSCDNCPLYGMCASEERTLEWLESEASE
jgi:hypothetical protein